jgi:hypothetical protein
MIVFEGVALLVLLITADIISSSVIEKRTFDVEPWQTFEPSVRSEENLVRASPKGNITLVRLVKFCINCLLLYFMLCVMLAVKF